VGVWRWVWGWVWAVTAGMGVCALWLLPSCLLGVFGLWGVVGRLGLRGVGWADSRLARGPWVWVWACGRVGLG